MAYEFGVNIGFGTDRLGGMHKDQSNEFAIRTQVLSAFNVLRAAPSSNAELLNQKGTLVCIVSGAFADLIAVNGNPLEDISCLVGQGENLSLIMKGGKISKNALV